MAEIKIDYTKICPHLVKNPVNLKPLSVDLGTGLESDERCEVGENLLDTEVLSDLMLKPKRIEVEVTCKGCEFLGQGFSKRVNAEVKP